MKKLCFSKTELIRLNHLFDLLRGKAISDLIKDSHFDLILFEGKRFFLDVKALVNTSFSKNILFDRPTNDESVEFRGIGCRCGFPIGWGNDLSDLKKGRKQTEVCYKKVTLTIP